MKPKKIIFGRTKACKERKKHLMSLRKCYDNVYDEITRIQEEFLNLGPKNWQEAERHFKGLPIDSLAESCQFDLKKSFKLTLIDMNKCSELSKREAIKAKQLDKLDDAIYLAELDVVISNIKDLLKKVDGP